MLIAAVYLFSFLVVLPLNGVVISATWNWYVAPVTGFRDLGFANGVGLAMFWSALSGQVAATQNKVQQDGPDDLWGICYMLLGIGVIGPLMGLGVAWIWHVLIMPQI